MLDVLVPGLPHKEYVTKLPPDDMRIPPHRWEEERLASLGSGWKNCGEVHYISKMAANMRRRCASITLHARGANIPMYICMCAYVHKCIHICIHVYMDHIYVH